MHAHKKNAKGWDRIFLNLCEPKNMCEAQVEYSHVLNKSAGTLTNTVEKFPTGTLINTKKI